MAEGQGKLSGWGSEPARLHTVVAQMAIDAFIVIFPWSVSLKEQRRCPETR